MFRGPALQHKKFFERYIDGAGKEVVVRQPAARPAPVSDVEKVLGTRETVTGDTRYGDEQTVNAVVSSPDALISDQVWGPKLIQSLGGTDVLDLILRAKLVEVLSDSLQPLGRTIFHSAIDVVIDGQAFKVTGVERSGMSPLDPYIAWVGLKKIGEA